MSVLRHVFSACRACDPAAEDGDSPNATVFTGLPQMAASKQHSRPPPHVASAGPSIPHAVLHPWCKRSNVSINSFAAPSRSQSVDRTSPHPSSDWMWCEASSPNPLFSGSPRHRIKLSFFVARPNFFSNGISRSCCKTCTAPPHIAPNSPWRPPPRTRTLVARPVLVLLRPTAASTSGDPTLSYQPSVSMHRMASLSGVALEYLAVNRNLHQKHSLLVFLHCPSASTRPLSTGTHRSLRRNSPLSVLLCTLVPTQILCRPFRRRSRLYKAPSYRP